MGLTKIVLRRPVSTVLVIVGIVVFGFFSIFNFDMELMPDIQLPMMMVMTVYPGADPDSIDQLITEEIEDAGASLSGVDSVLSYSYENYSVVAFTYDYDMDMNDAYTDLSAALDLLKFPEEAQDPTIIQMDVNALPTISISATNDGSSDMMAYINDTLVPRLESVPNVARVEVNGGRENYVRIQLNAEKMNQYKLNMAAVSAAIAGADYHVPAGTIHGGSQDISVNTSAKLRSLDDIRTITITTPTGAIISLGDVAEIYMDSKEANTISRYNGEPNVSVNVTKNQSASTVRVCRNVKKALDRLEETNPGVKFDISYDAGDSIVRSLRSVAQTLIIGVILAMIVLFVFFGDWRASLIVGSSMPISVFTTLVCMFLMGYDLNVITTGAMVIAIGMIVDSSIVVIESCFRMKETTENYRQAALGGAKTVAMSILASTITTCVVYAPLVMIKGMAGQMFSQLGMIIIFAMVASLISALSVVPLLYVFVRPEEKQSSVTNRILNKVRNAYERLVRRLMYRKKTTMLISVLLLIFSFLLASTLDFELIPTNYDGSIKITTTFRSGTTLDTMSETMKDLEQMVSEDKNFKTYSLSISNNTAVLTANAVDDCKRSSPEAVEEYTEKLSDMTDVDIFVESTGGGSEMTSNYSSDLVDVVLEGTDQDKLREASEMVEELMADTPGVIHVSSDAAAFKTAARVVVDPLKAANAGLAPAQVAMELYQTLTGMTSGSMEQNGEEYDIILNYPKGAYDDENQLRGKVLTGAAGQQVTLGEIARIEYSQQAQMIQRTNGKYQQTISATAMSDRKSEVNKKITNQMKKMDLPQGVAVSSSYVDDMRSENLSSIFWAILAGIFLVFLVMAMQFESPRFSLMVMTCIPFSLIGSFLLLFVTRSSLNMVSMMGFLMLMGIVVNNGILLVDTANQERQRMSIEDALARAGKIRLRPILMTTLTTILAMVPMALFSDNKMMSGMAFVIIGGLVASTLLCLLMMPAFYLLLSKDPDKKRGRKKKNKGDRGRKRRRKRKKGSASLEKEESGREELQSGSFQESERENRIQDLMDESEIRIVEERENIGDAKPMTTAAENVPEAAEPTEPEQVEKAESEPSELAETIEPEQAGQSGKTESGRTEQKETIEPEQAGQSGITESVSEAAERISGEAALEKSKSSGVVAGRISKETAELLQKMSKDKDF